MEIKEGNIFRFKVEKIITLQDGEYFILLAEYNCKYLLPAKYYLEYNIIIGQEIICRIDRVNCNGKVFLEPIHFIYSLGDRDIFLLREKEERIKYKTKDKYLVIRAENEKTKCAIVGEMLQYNNYSLNEKYICEIIKIKKGEVILKTISKA